jgi:ribonuclease E
MSEPGKSDRWNSLLETLGLPVSEAKPQPGPQETTEKPAEAGHKQPISMLRPEKPKPAPKPKPGAPAAKSPSYWSRIAGALGLEVPAAPEPAADPPAAAAELPKSHEQRAEPPQRHAAETTARKEELPSRAFDRPRPDRPSRGERPHREERRPRGERPPRREHGRHERPPVADEPPRSSLNEMFGPKEPDVNVFGLAPDEAPARRVEPDLPRTREADESGSVLDYDAPAAEGSDLPLETREDRPYGEAGEEGGEGDVRRRRRRRRGRGRRGQEPRHPSEAARHEDDIEPAGEEVDFDYGRELAAELDAEPDEERPSPERPSAERSSRGARRSRSDDRDRYPPRRDTGREPTEHEGSRRGGHSGGRTARRSEEESGAAYGEEPRREGHAGRPARTAAPPRDVREHDTSDDDASAELEEVTAGEGPTHKKIPTWEEAVNILIETNMAARAASPDRDRGRGRGRGRR